jgi:hypothetical protein
MVVREQRNKGSSSATLWHPAHAPAAEPANPEAGAPTSSAIDRVWSALGPAVRTKSVSMTGPNEKAAAGGGGGERRKYPIHVEDYELYEEIGQGVSAIVYRALCKPLDEIVAVKVVDFERTNSDLVRAPPQHSLFPFGPIRRPHFIFSPAASVAARPLDTDACRRMPWRTS